MAEDPGEEHNLAGTAGEAELADLLRAALEEVEAPSEQFAGWASANPPVRRAGE